MVLWSRVTDVLTGEKRIRIKYDDGTSEVADFPDKGILVDITGNGKHRAPPTSSYKKMRPILMLVSAAELQQQIQLEEMG